MAGVERKAQLKRALKHTIRQLGRIESFHGPASRILTYHSVGYRIHEMNVLPKDFQAQMEWLASYTSVIPLADAADNRPGLAITFDDGYRDNLIHAAPVLRQYKLPATVFMVAGRAGAVLHPEESYDTGALMTWEELRELAGMGIAIGSHTLTHRRLSSLPPEEQRREIMDSKTLLEDKLQRKITTFAYPFGAAPDYNDISVQYVREARYDCAVSNRYGPNAPSENRFALRRIWIDHTDDLALFQAKILGDLDLLRAMDSPWGIRIRRTLNRLLRVT